MTGGSSWKHFLLPTVLWFSAGFGAAGTSVVLFSGAEVKENCASLARVLDDTFLQLAASVALFSSPGHRGILLLVPAMFWVLSWVGVETDRSLCSAVMDPPSNLCSFPAGAGLHSDWSRPSLLVSLCTLEVCIFSLSFS
ncbi:hypothetical protein GDO81_008117 [Engystomops pustulosus]|uniref:Uncharacterized protein n=1 Tax=Engystomops pustulosus TaxID=76066 RepID=A0AAV7CD96_ENGPU|nr:hypothetical protein GDO81_008117 [Engystomops pustulosus]